MNATFTRLILAVAIVALAASSSSAVFITGNLVTDPSLESNPLIPIVQILGPPYTTGAWGAENGANVGAENGILPAAGARMHRMNDDGLIATQSFQLIDVSAYATDINAGNATVNANLLYNVPQDIPAAVAALYVNYYDAAHAGLPPITTGIGATLDSSPNTWQNLSVTNIVPANTKFLLLQGAFSNATMINAAGAHRPGYIDGARLTLTIIPEPTTLALGAIAIAGTIWLCKRR